MRRLSTSFTLLLVTALPLQAAEFSAGPGILLTDPIQRGADDDPRLIPLITVEGERFYFRGIEAGYRLVDQQRHGTAVYLRPRFDGFDADDDPFLRGMDDRDDSLDLGIRTTVSLGGWELGGRLATDALDRHDGQEAVLTLGYPWSAGRWRLTPYLGVEWQSADLVDYYYGVENDEARAGRPAYAAGGTVNGRYGLRAFGRLSARWSAMVILAGTRPGSEITDSPLVTDDNRLSAITGLQCRF